MSNEPLLSIITVSAFDGKRLAKTLHSLAGVSSFIEHVVVIPKDDIESKAIWESHSDSAPHPMLLAHDEGQGVYPAMNIGINASRGRYVCFWNAGDELVSQENLESLLENLDTGNPKWVICQGEFQWRSSQELSVLNLFGFIKHKAYSFISHQTVIVNRDTFISIGSFDCRYRVAADTAMITRMCSIEIPRWEESVVVKVEAPQFASHNHRLARIEVFLIALRDLQGSQRIQALKNIFYTETKRLVMKMK